MPYSILFCVVAVLALAVYAIEARGKDLAINKAINTIAATTGLLIFLAIAAVVNGWDRKSYLTCRAACVNEPSLFLDTCMNSCAREPLFDLDPAWMSFKFMFGFLAVLIQALTLRLVIRFVREKWLGLKSIPARHYFADYLPAGAILLIFDLAAAFDFDFSSALAFGVLVSMLVSGVVWRLQYGRFLNPLQFGGSFLASSSVFGMFIVWVVTAAASLQQFVDRVPPYLR